MAGRLAPFLDGSQVVVKIDGVELAFCETISFNDSMQVQTTFGIGNYGPHTVEPLQYAASGNLRILRYTSQALKIGNTSGAIASGASVKKNIPAIEGKNANPRGADGNSMMFLNSFSPIRMLLDTTFDIEVWTRTGNGARLLSYVLKDCLITNLGIAFSPGSLVNENIGFVCLRVDDVRAESAKTSTPT